MQLLIERQHALADTKVVAGNECEVCGATSDARAAMAVASEGSIALPTRTAARRCERCRPRRSAVRMWPTATAARTSIGVGVHDAQYVRPPLTGRGRRSSSIAGAAPICRRLVGTAEFDGQYDIAV